MKSASCPPSQADRSLFTAPLSRPILVAAAGPSTSVMFRYCALYAFVSCLALNILSGSGYCGQNFVVVQAIRGDQNHLFVPVSVNNQNKSWWLVDTGAPISTITESAARKASLQGPEVASRIPTSVKVEGQDH